MQSAVIKSNVVTVTLNIYGKKPRCLFSSVLPFKTRRFYFALVFCFRSSSNLVLSLRLAEVCCPSVLQRSLKHPGPTACHLCNLLDGSDTSFWEERSHELAKGFVHMEFSSPIILSSTDAQLSAFPHEAGLQAFADSACWDLSQQYFFPLFTSLLIQLLSSTVQVTCLSHIYSTFLEPLGGSGAQWLRAQTLQRDCHRHVIGVCLWTGASFLCSSGTLAVTL